MRLSRVHVEGGNDMFENHRIYKKHRNHIRKLTLLILGLLLLPPSHTDAQETAMQAYQQTVIIDIQSLSEKSRAAVISALAKLKPSTEWPKTTVRSDDNLYSIINDRYHFYQGVYPETTENIVAAIQIANGLADINSIRAGQQLVVPVLPQRPFGTGTEKEYAQVLNLHSNEIFLAQSKDLPLLPGVGETAQKNIRTGDVWVIQMSSEASEALFRDLRKTGVTDHTIKRNIYSGPMAQTAEFNVPEPIASEVPAESRKSNISNLFQGLDISRTGKYYLLDFYAKRSHQDCPHGTLVLESAKTTLKNYGMGHLKDQIVPMELAFFENKDAALDQIKTYIAQQGERIKYTLQEAVKILKEMKRPGTDKGAVHVVPLLYLQALYANLILAPDTALISSSFYTYFDGYKIFPYTYSTDCTIPLLSAVLDYPNSEIESFPAVEPLRSFWDFRKDYGVILVGAEDGSGNAIGMSSRNADGVTCLARGVVLGTTGTCVGIQRVGTSFATPVIGSQLLLARAFWKAKGMDISAKEAKVRLLLSSELVASYVGRYASGGIPRIERLLLEEGAFGVMLDGSCVNLPNADGGNSYVKVRSHDCDGLADQLVFGRGDHRFCGIQKVGERVFIFREDAMKWDEVKIESVKFEISDQETLDSLDKLFKRYKGVIAL